MYLTETQAYILANVQRVPLVNSAPNGFLLKHATKYIIAHMFLNSNSQGSSLRPRAVGFRLRQPKGFYL